MKLLKYPLSEEGYVNRFITTGVFTEPQTFKKAVLQGKVNEWLKKGFSIHENPCRNEFIARRRENLPEYLDISQTALGGTAEVFGRKNVLRVYFPFGNIGYEESGFYFCPTYLRTYCWGILTAEKEEFAEFVLETCGGVTIWNNDEFVTDYIPFTRNMVKHTAIKIPLKKGENKLILCLDDLAERDTDYYFRLKYKGIQNLSILLPLPESVDLDKVYRYEKILDNICFEKETYISEPVNLAVPGQLLENDLLKMTIANGEWVEKMQHEGEEDPALCYNLKRDMRKVTLLEAKDMLPGFYFFDFELKEGPVSVKRKLGNQIVWKELLVNGSEDSRERKKQLLDTIIHYSVDNSYKAAACFQTGYCLEDAEKMILNEIVGVNQRQDCSDFHFTTILFTYFRHGDKMSDRLKSVIKDAALNYRYWIDEPGDDVMWFFSENHALLFHTCQYLAGLLFPEDLFTNSGKTGKEVSARGRELLEEWFEEFFREFITEWNSNAYIPVDVHGLATIYNITKEGDGLHEKAKKALDMVSYSLAVNAHKGAVMTSFGRTYEKEMKGNYNAGTTALLYLFYNAGYLARNGMGCVAVASGDYEAPQEYRQYITLEEGQSLIFENTQGFEQHANLYTFKNNQVQLSTAIGFKPFQNGYQEHILQASIDETAQVFINHPGETHPYGSGRPNFWAGNSVLPLALQYENLAILVFHVPEENRIDYTHAYIPLSEFSQYKGQTDSVALEKDGGYIGVKAMNEICLTKTGPVSHREFISRGRKNVWVVKVETEAQAGDFEDFFESVADISIDWKEDGTVLVTDGERKYRIGRDFKLYVDGISVHNYPMEPAGKITVKGKQRV